MKKKRVLIASVSAGSGHIRAAEALKAQAAILHPEWEVLHLDLAEFVSLPTKKAFFDSYGMLVRQLPELWGYIYEKADSPKRRKLYEHATKVLQKIDSRKFIAAIEEFGPTHIIYTHFTPADIIASAKTPHLHVLPQHIVVTDYDAHHLWVMKGNYTYSVATDKMKWKMTKWGVQENNITVTGIPVDPVFFAKSDTLNLKKKLRLKGEKKTVLVLGGGHGLIKIDAIVQALLALKEPLNVIAVAGSNTKLQAKLKAMKSPKNISYRVIGWTHEMHILMTLADLVITKPGGLTTSECLALRKSMIVVDPIPGQEEHNADYILSHQLGVIAQSVEDVQYYTLFPPKNRHPKPRKNPAESILKKL